MRIYKVVEMVVNYGYSLTPALGPIVTPPPRAVLAGFPGYTIAYRALLKAGYTDPQIMTMFQRWFTYNVYTMGLTANQAWNVVSSQVAIMTEPPPPPLIPISVYFAVGVVAIIFVAKSLISPMNFHSMTIPAPSTMYVFANEEFVTLGELLAVSPRGKGLYEICGEVGGPLIAHKRNQPFAPGVLDQMWFGGTVMWRGWHFPYFRRYYHMYWWVHYLDVVDWQGASMYYLKHNAKDPFLPGAPYIRPGGPWGTSAYSGIYANFPWGLVP